MIDPAEARRLTRHRWSRIGLPIVGVGLIIAAILGIAWYSYTTNKRDALQLADEVIQSQAQRISREVDAYLGPAPRAVELLRGVLSDGKFLGAPQGGAEAIGWQILFDNPQLALISYAAPDGSFMMTKRETSGAIDTKVIERKNDKPETTWTRRDPQGSTTSIENDPNDTYDPRTRVWFKGAIEAKGKVHWSRLYIFFTDQKPGLTASGALFDAKGDVAAVFGVDIALDTLSRFLASLQIGATGRAMIVDDEGKLVAYPDAAKTFKRVGEQLLPAALDELGDDVLTRAYNRFRVEGHGRRTIEIGGRRYITAATPIQADADHNWSTLIVVPEADFVGFVALNNQSTLLMSLGVVVLAALFAGLLIRQGLRADRNAELVVQREQSREAQSRAFAELAANAALFDPSQEDAVQALTKIAARAVGAKRFGLWRASSDANMIILEDCRDRENDGHTAGVELTRPEIPAFFAAAEAGEELEVADAAKDPRTAEFHKLYLKRMGSRSIATVPIRSADRWLGLVVVEDYKADGTLSFARAVANMLAVRFAARARAMAAPGVPAVAAQAAGIHAARVVGAAPAPTLAMRRSTLSSAQRSKLESGDGGASAVTARVFPRTTVLAVRFTDPMAIAEEHAEEDKIVALDRMARAMEQIAAAHAIEYVKIVGDKLVIADGFVDADTTEAARSVAEAALALQERAARLFTGLGHQLEFRMGIDTGTVIGSAIGAHQEAYNLWGEGLRMAETMAESGLPGSIVVTETTYRLLRDHYLFRVRGAFYLGGAGEMSTYVLTGRA